MVEVQNRKRKRARGAGSDFDVAFPAFWREYSFHRTGLECYAEQYSNRIGCLLFECHQDWKCADDSAGQSRIRAGTMTGRGSIANGYGSQTIRRSLTGFTLIVTRSSQLRRGTSSRSNPSSPSPFALPERAGMCGEHNDSDSPSKSWSSRTCGFKCSVSAQAAQDGSFRSRPVNSSCISLISPIKLRALSILSPISCVDEPFQNKG